MPPVARWWLVSSAILVLEAFTFLLPGMTALIWLFTIGGWGGLIGSYAIIASILYAGLAIRLKKHA